MIGKLHIKAIAKHEIKVDAYWYKSGDSMDCYISPQYFKDIILSDGFEDFDIILDENSSPIISTEYKVLETEVVDNGKQVSNTRTNENKSSGKITKKTISK